MVYGIWIIAILGALAVYGMYRMHQWEIKERRANNQ